MIQDLRYAIRVLTAQKGFTLVAVLTLALGIGVNTTIFSLVDAILFRPLPVAASGELVAVYNKDTVNNSLGEEDSISYPDFVDYRDKNDVFSGMIAYGVLEPATIGNADDTELATGDFVSGNFFDVLGVKAHIGSVFHPEDDSRSAAPVAVLSYSTWQRRFAGDPGIVGRRVNFYRIPFTIVGVADAKFTGLIKGISPEFWIPVRQQEILYGSDRNHFNDRRNNNFLVAGRLKPGVTLNAAKTQMTSLARGLSETYPDSNKDRRLTLLPLNDVIFAPAADRAVRLSAAVLLALAGFVLLIACANLANLLLARSTTRRKEIAVRLAVGGSRWRLIRQLLTESVVLSVLGGLAGLLVASWSAGFLNVIEIPLPIRVDVGAEIDWRVLAFTFVMSLVTGVVFGLLPAVQSAKTSIVAALKDEAGADRGSGPKWTRSTLVISQVAVSMFLLVFAGLAFRSLRNAASVNPGFNTDKLGVAVVEPTVRGYDETRTRNFSRETLARVRRLPGVRSAAIAGNLPLTFSIHLMGYSTEGPETLPRNQWKYVDGTLVSDGYFRTMQIPIVEGREFSETDETAGAQRVIINATMAKRLWPGETALGRRLYVSVAPRGGLVSAEVIGVVADGKYRTLGEQQRPFVYGNLLQNFMGGTLVVRAQDDLQPVFTGIRSVVREMDPTVPVFAMQEITERMRIVLLVPRYAAMLFGGFGLLGAALAIVGLYGVISYSVSRRTHEIGIRMAIGGQRNDVLKLVIREGMTLTAAGLGLGLLLAAIASRFISAILYGVSSADPLTFAAISALMALVSFIACCIPAFRASRVDPMVALRYE
jgi:macrolide transport system ATP-binding/permease protein